MTPGPVNAIIARTRCLLIDFDGPVCDIYAGLTDTTVAERLRKVITGHGITGIPVPIASSHDPIAVFDYAASISPEIGALVEIEMTDLETAATATARPTPYVHEVLTSARDTGRVIAIVSNNSAAALCAYLAQHGLADHIDYISARTTPNPALLKPSPHLLTQAITALNAHPAESAIIGDSITDIQAARAAGIASIGSAVIGNLADLGPALRLRPQRWLNPDPGRVAAASAADPADP
jgi:phosphoglycolate phosphatase